MGVFDSFTGKINPWHQLYQHYEIVDDSDGVCSS
jgi:hypothetical protein